MTKMVKDTTSPTPLFGPHYIQGYTAALLDIQSIIEDSGFRDDMKRHKMPMNWRNMAALIRCVIDNRVMLREDPDAFVRCTKDKRFEMVSGSWRHPVQDGNTKEE